MQSPHAAERQVVSQADNDLKSIDAQLRRYREAALLRAAPGDGPAGSNNARKRWLRDRERTVPEMRRLAEDVCGRGPEGQRLFADLISGREPSATRRWAAFHVLELCSLPAEVETQAVGAIEAATIEGSADWHSDQVWLRRWRASRGPRSELVMELCRIPVDWSREQWSMVDLLKATGYCSGKTNLTAAEVAECLQREPGLVEAWLQYCSDQRCSPAWIVGELSPREFVLRRVPSGDQFRFTNRVEAVAEFAVRVITDAG